MSAFQYYSKMQILPVDRKRKNKKKTKQILIKKRKIENGVVDSTIKTKNNVLNSIYSLNLKNSTKTGQKLLEWLIHPISIDHFMK